MKCGAGIGRITAGTGIQDELETIRFGQIHQRGVELALLPLCEQTGRLSEPLLHQPARSGTPCVATVLLQATPMSAQHEPQSEHDEPGAEAMEKLIQGELSDPGAEAEWVLARKGDPGLGPLGGLIAMAVDVDPQTSATYDATNPYTRFDDARDGRVNDAQTRVNDVMDGASTTDDGPLTASKTAKRRS